MKYDVAIVGGGMAGLTSAAYLCSYGYKVVVLEQQKKVGGLVNSFSHNGFLLDGGIRAIENSGILFPMLRQLGIEIEFVKNTVSLIIGQEHLLLKKKEDFLQQYCSFMKKSFPENKPDIDALVQKIDTSMRYMHVLYGFDNPLFVDLKADIPYAFSLLPWLFKYLMTIGKIDALTQPIDEYLHALTDNLALVDMFAQHFFYKTPAFFALSYFSLYMDYQYPVGGTGALAKKMEAYILQKGGSIRLNCEIAGVECERKQLWDEHGTTIGYKKMIWAADSRQLYNKINLEAMQNSRLASRLQAHRALLQDKTGSDSIFTVYLMLHTPAKELAKHMSAHVFYTPQLSGLSNTTLTQAKKQLLKGGTAASRKKALLEWAALYLQANTFEISCPAMRDEALAPRGKSALIISFLFDYLIMTQIRQMGFYDEFKRYCEDRVCEIVFDGLLKAFKAQKIECFSSSPLTIERFTGNTGGSVTGWGFANQPVPGVTKMSKIASAIKTPVPNVWQAGQWTFAPSGLPVAVLTGKLAADAVKKDLT